jgi:hypothetical protein
MDSAIYNIAHAIVALFILPRGNTMGRKRKRGRGTTSPYFREIFEERPELLHSQSNEELITRWRNDHPNESEAELRRVRGRLANLKSLMRKEERKRGGRGSGRSAATRPDGFAGSLEDLEVAIDECLTRAKVLDAEGLDDVIQLLRRARNRVVWKSGQ